MHCSLGPLDVTVQLCHYWKSENLNGWNTCVHALHITWFNVVFLWVLHAMRWAPCTPFHCSIFLDQPPCRILHIRVKRCPSLDQLQFLIFTSWKGGNEFLSSCLNPHLLISAFSSEVAAFAISFVSSNGRQTLLPVAGREPGTYLVWLGFEEFSS